MASRAQDRPLKLVPALVRAEAEDDVRAVSDPGPAPPVSEARPSTPVTRGAGDQLADQPDARLVVLATSGDRAAIGALYHRHVVFAINLATRIQGYSTDVEDLVHDAFLRALERLGSLEDPAAFRGWLGSIIVYAMRTRMRRHRLMSALGLERSEPIDLDALASPHASAEVRAQLAQIYALLRTLPTDDRIAWTLRSVEGHDLETVARMASCSLATVKRRIARVQRFLDEHFIDATAHASVASAAASEGATR